MNTLDCKFISIADLDIIHAYNWMKTFLSEKEWNKRYVDIDNRLSLKIQQRKREVDISQGLLGAISDDKIDWYLYLIHNAIFEPQKYDYYSSARIMPIFKRIGMNLDLVKGIGGIDKKMKTLLYKNKKEVDAILFEILTALLWKRNQWEVKFIEEGKGGKTPDMEVVKEDKIWQIECKRQSKTADYTYKETEKRQKVVSHISEQLLAHSLFLDITFHKELSTYEETYLKVLLSNSIPTLKTGDVIKNKDVSIVVSSIDYRKVKDYLKKYGCVKLQSPQFIELLTDKEIDHSSFTCGVLGQTCLCGEGESNNLYYSKIDKVFGVVSTCDAEDAIKAKARDVKRQIDKAVKQFNALSQGIIHIGIDTYDGKIVEDMRREKIADTLKQLDAPNLDWIYIHYFQSYSRSNEPWIIDETVEYISADIFPIRPLAIDTLVVPEDDLHCDVFHWDRPLP